MSSSCSDAFSLASLPGGWNCRAVPVIGLTGAIGGGKSQVAALLGRKGAVVIDADCVGHEVLDCPEVHRQVIERFGAGVVEHGPDGAAHGSINRRALGSIVFAARPALEDLEAIVHPRMRRQFEAIIDRESVRGRAPMVVLDAAVLLEAGWDNLCDLLVFVDASQSVRLQRVSRSRGWTAAVLQAREAAQWPREQKLSRADIVIQNDSSLEILDQNVDRLWRLVTDRWPAASRDSGTPAASRLSGSASGCCSAATLQPGDPR